MELDLKLFHDFERGRIPSTLRIYSWQPRCVSHGYAQKLEEIDVLLCHGSPVRLEEFEYIFAPEQARECLAIWDKIGPAPWSRVNLLHVDSIRLASSRVR